MRVLRGPRTIRAISGVCAVFRVRGVVLIDGASLNGDFVLFFILIVIVLVIVLSDITSRELVVFVVVVVVVFILVHTSDNVTGMNGSSLSSRSSPSSGDSKGSRSGTGVSDRSIIYDRTLAIRVTFLVDRLQRSTESNGSNKEVDSGDSVKTHFD